MLKRIILFIPIIILSACLEESSEKLDKKAFTKIYDNNEFYSSFYAIDMQQTDDAGYLILGGKTSVVKEGGESQNVNSPLGIYILKVDALGNIVKALVLEDDYVYPAGKLNRIGDSFYFFCMNAGTETQLANVDQLAELALVSPIPTGVKIPLASGLTEDRKSLLLLTYDNETQESVVSIINP
ncbi:unnamed protein product, partial [Phaeothamnion confervicola]